MPSSFVRVYVHYVWSTKYHRRVLTVDQRRSVQEHIHRNASKKGIHILALNVQPEHVHLLVSIGRSDSVDDIPFFVKGESSHWINENRIVSGHFSWQRGYWAESVTPRQLKRLQTYIDRQDEHHQRRSYRQEVAAFLLSQGFSQEEVSQILREEAAEAAFG